jgi:hypothetical protein
MRTRRPEAGSCTVDLVQYREPGAAFAEKLQSVLEYCAVNAGRANPTARATSELVGTHAGHEQPQYSTFAPSFLAV